MNIVITGLQDAKKELIAFFLEQQGGANCALVNKLADITPLHDGGSCFDMVLWDVQEIAEPLIFSSIESFELSSQIPLALFGVDPERMFETKAMQSGVKGFFYTTDPLELLLKGLAHICQGEIWVPRKVMERCFFSLERAGHSLGDNHDNLLTARELEVLELIHAGYSNSDIAEKLSISIHTIKAHTYKAFKKSELKTAYRPPDGWMNTSHNNLSAVAIHA